LLITFSFSLLAEANAVLQ
jgi:hypothetical protein